MAERNQIATGHGHIEAGCDEQGESYRIAYDRDAGQNIATCVVLGVAEAAGADPVELEQLNSVIDAEALDELFDRDRQGHSTDRVSFNYHDYRVTIYRDDEILIQPRQEAEPAAAKKRR